MLLAIDVGNTNIVLGVFRDRELVHSWRLTTIRERTADELGILVTDLCDHYSITRAEITGIVIASVVPPLTGTLVAMVAALLRPPPRDVRARRQRRHADSVRQPNRSGRGPRCQRHCGGRAIWPRRTAHHHRGLRHRDHVRCDLGEGRVPGRCDLSGPQISADALFQRAARLPRIDVKKPAKVIGTNTVASMQAGLYWGYVDMVEGLVRRITAELGGEAIVIATGGLASIVAPETTLIQHVDAELTLQGLRIVWERNQ